MYIRIYNYNPILFTLKSPNVNSYLLTDFEFEINKQTKSKFGFFFMPSGLLCSSIN